MQTLEQIVGIAIDNASTLGRMLRASLDYDNEEMYEITLDKLAKLREDTIRQIESLLQIKQLIKEKSNV